MIINSWDDYPNFERAEFVCQCGCNRCDISPEIVDIVQHIRNELNKPLFISSGYRCAEHPVEKMKDRPGEHTAGFAVDIIAHGAVALFVIASAQHLGVRRIGLHQKGRASGRYVHLGIADKYTKEYPVAIWTY